MFLCCLVAQYWAAVWCGRHVCPHRIVPHSAIRKQVVRVAGLSVLGTPASCFAVAAVQHTNTVALAQDIPAVRVMPAMVNTPVALAPVGTTGIVAVALLVTAYTNILARARGMPAVPARLAEENTQPAIARVVITRITVLVIRTVVRMVSRLVVPPVDV